MLTEVCTAFFDRAVDRRQLIGRILDAAIELTSGDRGAVFLVQAADPASKAEPAFLTSMVATGLKGGEIKVPTDQGIVGHVFKTRFPLIINDAQSDPRFFGKIDQATSYRTETILCVPMRTPKGRVVGVIEILNSKKGRFDEEDQGLLEVLALFASVALDQKDSLEELASQNESLRHERKNWIEMSENLFLSSSHPTLRSLFTNIPSYAKSDSNILIEGQSGTGKEVIARVLHGQSNRRDKPFIPLNCAAIPESLFEAELFGVARGAATGTAARKGKIELAQNGTLFLDEIGELPLSLQAKLLRVLQDKTVARVGTEEEAKKVDFRVISATNRDLAQMVADGRFREDLFYRINVVRVELPSLKERGVDIPEIVRTVLRRFNVERGWKVKSLSPEALALVEKYPWPGNIRQLQNKLESAIIVSGERNILEPQDFQFEGARRGQSEPALASPPLPTRDLNLRKAKHELEKQLIQEALRQSDGNKTKAALKLGITREGLRKALKLYGG